MNVRHAAAEDYEAIADLWRQFDHEVPPPTHEGPADVEKELSEVREIIDSEIALVTAARSRSGGPAPTTGRPSGSRSRGAEPPGSGRSPISTSRAMPAAAESGPS